MYGLAKKICNIFTLIALLLTISTQMAEAAVVINNGEFLRLGQWRHSTSRTAYEPEPTSIMWEKKSDNVYLTYFLVDTQQWNTTNQRPSTGWEGTSLYAWLTGTFYENAFSSTEKSVLKLGPDGVEGEFITIPYTTASPVIGSNSLYGKLRYKPDGTLVGQRYWLRRPYQTNQDLAWGVGVNGLEGYAYLTEANGISPIINLNLSLVTLKSGVGTQASPYQLYGTSDAMKPTSVFVNGDTLSLSLGTDIEGLNNLPSPADFTLLKNGASATITGVSVSDTESNVLELTLSVPAIYSDSYTLSYSLPINATGLLPTSAGALKAVSDNAVMTNFTSLSVRNETPSTIDDILINPPTVYGIDYRPLNAKVTISNATGGGLVLNGIIPSANWDDSTLSYNTGFGDDRTVNITGAHPVQGDYYLTLDVTIGETRITDAVINVKIEPSGSTPTEANVLITPNPDEAIMLRYPTDIVYTVTSTIDEAVVELLDIRQDGNWYESGLGYVTDYPTNSMHLTGTPIKAGDYKLFFDVKVDGVTINNKELTIKVIYPPIDPSPSDIVVTTNPENPTLIVGEVTDFNYVISTSIASADLYIENIRTSDNWSSGELVLTPHTDVDKINISGFPAASGTYCIYMDVVIAGITIKDYSICFVVGDAPTAADITFNPPIGHAKAYRDFNATTTVVSRTGAQLTLNNVTEGEDWEFSGMDFSFDSTNRSITVSGMPTEAGSYYLDLDVTIGSSSVTGGRLLVTVDPAGSNPTFANVIVTSDLVGSLVEGNPTSYTYTVTSNIPDAVVELVDVAGGAGWDDLGLTLTPQLDDNQIQVSGTPLLGGSYKISMDINIDGIALDGYEVLVQVKDAASASDIIFTPDLPHAKAYRPYSAWTVVGTYTGEQLLLNDVTPRTGWTTSGLSFDFNPRNKVVSIGGTPTTPGTYYLDLDVTIGESNVTDGVLSVTVDPVDSNPTAANITVTSDLTGSIVAGIPTQFTYTVGSSIQDSVVSISNVTGGANWDASGLTLTPNLSGKQIAVEGTPLAAGTYTILMDVTIDGTLIEDYAVSFNVKRQPTAGDVLFAPPIPTATAYRPYSAWTMVTTDLSEGIILNDVTAGTNWADSGLSFTFDTRTKIISIEGTPNGAGNYTLNLDVTIGATNITNSVLTVTAVPTGATPTESDILVTSDLSGSIVVDTPVSFTYTVSSNIQNAQITLSNVEGGTDWDASGLTLTPDLPNRQIAVSGTPLAAGTYTILMDVTIDGVLFEDHEETLTVEDQPTPGGVTFTPPLPKGKTYREYSAWTVVGSDNGQTLILNDVTATSGWADSGLSFEFDAVTKYISVSGLPTIPGNYQLDLDVTIGGISTSGVLTVVVEAVGTNPTDDDVTVSSGSSSALVTGNEASYSYTVGSSIPGSMVELISISTSANWADSGLTAQLNGNQIEISGTPLLPGTYTIIFSVKIDGVLVEDHEVTVVVTDRPTAANITFTPAIPDAVVYRPYSAWTMLRSNIGQQLVLNDVTISGDWSDSGLSFTFSSVNETVTISGTPTTAGDYSLILDVTIGEERITDGLLTVKVNPSETTPTDGNITVTSDLVGSLIVDNPTSFTYTVGSSIHNSVVVLTNVRGGANWAASGLAIDATQLADKKIGVSGTPALAGTYTVLMDVTIDGTLIADHAETITVLAKPTASDITFTPPMPHGKEYREYSAWTVVGTDSGMQLTLNNVTASGDWADSGLSFTFDPRTKLISVSGAPTEEGNYALNLDVTIGVTNITNGILWITIDPADSNPTEANVVVTSDLIGTLVQGAPTTYTYTVTSNIPDALVELVDVYGGPNWDDLGLTITPDFGDNTIEIDGAPLLSGTYRLYLDVTIDGLAIDGYEVLVQIKEAATASNITFTPVLPNAKAYRPYSAWTIVGTDTGEQLTLNGVTASADWATSDLSFDVNTRNKVVTVSGTSTTPGTYYLTLDVTIGQTRVTNGVLPVVVEPSDTNPTEANVIITSDLTSSVVVGVETQFTYLVSSSIQDSVVTLSNVRGGTGWAAGGLTLTPNLPGRQIAVSGTPLAAGTYTILMDVTIDGTLIEDCATSFNVKSQPTAGDVLFAPSIPNATAYRPYSTWTMVTTDLSEGITLNDVTAGTNWADSGLSFTFDPRTKIISIEGTPDGAGSYTLNLDVTIGTTNITNSVLTVVAVSSGSVPTEADIVVTSDLIGSIVVDDPVSFTYTVGSSVQDAVVILTEVTGGTDWAASGLTLTPDLPNRQIAVSGTPLAAGTYTILMDVTIDGVAFQDHEETLIIRAETPPGDITFTPPLPSGKAYRQYSAWTVLGSSSNQPLTLNNVTAGANWATSGLSFEFDVRTKFISVSGMPTTAGTYSLNLDVTIDGSNVTSGVLTITITSTGTNPTENDVEVTSDLSGSLMVGNPTSYSYTIGSSIPDAVVELISMTPGANWADSGLTAQINGNEIEISGTPLRPGTYTIIFSVKVDGELIEDQEVTVVVTDRPTAANIVLTPSIPDATAHRPYSAWTVLSSNTGAQLTLNNVTASADWNTSGLTFNFNPVNKTVTISGTPTTAGNYFLTLDVTIGDVRITNGTLTVKVNPVGTTPSENNIVVTSDLTGSLVVGNNTSFTYTVSSSIQDSTVTLSNVRGGANWAASGLTLTPNLANKKITVSGTPLVAGTYAILMDVSIDGTLFAGHTETITILSRPTASDITLTPPIPDAKEYVAYSAWTVLGTDTGMQLTLNNVTAATGWADSGLSFTFDPRTKLVSITGTPSAEGTYSLNLDVTIGSFRITDGVILVTVGPGDGGPTPGNIVVTSSTTDPIVVGTPTEITYTVSSSIQGSTVALSNVRAGANWVASGLTLTPQTATRQITISGTPTTAGTYSILMDVSIDGVLFEDYEVTIYIRSEVPPAVITFTPPIPNAKAYREYNAWTIVGTDNGQQLTLNNVTAGTGWSDSGLEFGFDATTKVITIWGTPTTTGSYTLNLDVTINNARLTNPVLTVTVDPTGTTPTPSNITVTSSLTGTPIAGNSLNFTYTVGSSIQNAMVELENVRSGSNWTGSGLSFSVDLDNNKITVSGTPTSAGTYTLTMDVRIDGVLLRDYVESFTVKNRPTAGDIYFVPLLGNAKAQHEYNGWTVVGASSGNLTLNGVTAGSNWSSSGLNFSYSSASRMITISGTPTTPGTYSLNLNLSVDQIAINGVTLSLTVDPADSEPTRDNIIVTANAPSVFVVEDPADVTYTITSSISGARVKLVSAQTASGWGASGLVLTPNTSNATFRIHGTPVAAGMYTLLLDVEIDGTLISGYSMSVRVLDDNGGDGGDGGDSGSSSSCSTFSFLSLLALLPTLKYRKR